jgi:hypothetical protein
VVNFPNVKFYKVDIDINRVGRVSPRQTSSSRAQETAGEEEIHAMPTFKYYKNGVCVRLCLSPVCLFDMRTAG